MNRINHKMLDVIGVGIGPSNLSLAALLNACPDISARFFDRRREFQWHEGLLLASAELQVPFIKDLVTPVDPTNPFSFLNYLRSQQRLHQFLNAEYPRVLRREFNQYFRWVCQQLPTLFFGVAVEKVEFDGDCFAVKTEHQTFYARHVVLGLGVSPLVPACARSLLGPTLFHASDLLRNRDSLAGLRVAVIGGGQTGAEIVLSCIDHGCPSIRELTWLTRRANFLPLDESPFVNEMFTPVYSDYFFQLDRLTRQQILQEFKLASDGISSSTLRTIYRRLYEIRYLEGSPAIRLLPAHELTDVEPSISGGWTLKVEDLLGHCRHELDVDACILCTGYKPTSPKILSEELLRRLSYEGKTLQLKGDFSVVWDGPDSARMYFQNHAREIRGIADPNLSLLAWRSAKIINSIAGYEVYSLDDCNCLVDWALRERRPVSGTSS